ncbi:hypothetical protein [Flavobacterium litorale]|uniref:Uncharacterized protein n=1 Tax=Flavobacterium litorale TaxID=2856519 RepID=A0ABX8V8D4_9FLAO|nr:hypothetical protein [Flavobacterium litorale]QYJ69109.1 hypothetical protein K1I41_04260 [Flavobacterium litorale]
MITQKIISFLINRDWKPLQEENGFISLKPPKEFNLEDNFNLYIPIDVDKVDTSRFINNILGIVADFYDLSIDDLDVILEKENTVFKVRVYDGQTEEGRIPLTRFEELVEKVRFILSDTASFVIDRSVTSTRVPEEVNRYLNLCNFMQTEKGSFVAKIQLPSRELIKESELFDRNEVFSEEINQKLKEVLLYVNENIFEGSTEVTEEYLIENETRLNIKLLKNIEAFFTKANLKNIDFSFHNIQNSGFVINRNITKLKLSKLTKFVEDIESYSFEVGDFSFTGAIVALKSRNPDGLKNSVTFTGIHDNMQMVATANLDSEDYKHAIEAHKLKQQITITGLAKRTKSRARFIEITNIDIQE